MSWIKYSKKNKIPTELEQHLESTNGGRCAFLASVYGYYAYSRASRLKCHESSTLRQAIKDMVWHLANCSLQKKSKISSSRSLDPFQPSEKYGLRWNFPFSSWPFCRFQFVRWQKSFCFLLPTSSVADSKSSSSASGSCWVHSCKETRAHNPRFPGQKAVTYIEPSRHRSQRSSSKVLLAGHLGTASPNHRPLTQTWLIHSWCPCRKFDLTRGPLVSWMLAGWPWLASRCGWRWEMNGKCCFNIITLPIRFHPLIHRCMYVCAVS